MDDVNIDLTIENNDDEQAVDKEVIKIVDDLLAKKEIYAKKKQETTDLFKDIKIIETSLHAKMEDLGFQSFKTDNATVFKKFQYWAKVTDEQSAREYFADEGIEQEMFKTSVVKGRLNDLVRKLAEKGLALPPGIDYTITPTVGLRRR